MIPQEQNSEEWLKWRNGQIGASDIPIIMGLSKWCTRNLLWRRKLGFTSPEDDNWATFRGRHLEKHVIDLAHEHLLMEFTPEVVVHPSIKWASASLDGIDRKRECILEIKCPGIEDHKIAESGEVPAHYYPQVQWQLFCTGYTVCYYFSFYEKDGHHYTECVPVERDDEYIDKLLFIATDFKRSMVEMIEPPLVKKDLDEPVEIEDPDFHKLTLNWRAANEMKLFYTEKEKCYKEELIRSSGNKNCHGYGVSLKNVSKTGNINWKNVWKEILFEFPLVEEVIDPEKFRGEETTYWKIHKDK